MRSKKSFAAFSCFLLVLSVCLKLLATRAELQKLGKETTTKKRMNVYTVEPAYWK